MNEILGVNLQDINTQFVILHNGKYLIDNKVIDINNKSQIKVNDVNNIRRITDNVVISYYQDANHNTLSIEEYNNNIKILTQNAIKNYDNIFNFKDIDDEYAYKKFITKWQPIKTFTQTLSEPLLVEVIYTKLHTGNPYIVPAIINDFTNINKSKIHLCTYNRPAACLSIVNNYMDKLGFKFVNDNNYNVQSEWTNSQHSCIKYVKAFGKYIFDHNWDIKYNYTDTLDLCLDKYNYDKSNIEKIIYEAYIIKFGYIKEQIFDFKDLVDNIENIIKLMTSVESKVSTKSIHQQALNNLKNIKYNIINQFKI